MPSTPMAASRGCAGVLAGKQVAWQCRSADAAREEGACRHTPLEGFNSSQPARSAPPVIPRQKVLTTHS